MNTTIATTNTFPALPIPPTHLPEILHAIAKHLDPPDLLNCVQVCQLWHQTFLPSLWHTIDDRCYSWPHILPLYDSEDSLGDKDEAWLQLVFAKHGHLIRYLVCTWKILIDIVGTITTTATTGSLMSCTSIHTLLIYNINENVTEAEECEERWYSNQIMGQAATRYRPGNPTAQTGQILAPLFEGMLVPLKANDRTPDQQRRDWETVQRFWMLVRQSPRLRRLRLDAGFGRLCGVKDTKFVYEILGGLKELCVLENDGLVELDADRLAAWLPQLQTYRTISE
ncbi:hypothetical protein BGX23_010951 [Mortierella sp. AD031]|nr:hypothetical protein BGX23_010951 [Mortierella sp. AD031]